MNDVRKSINAILYDRIVSPLSGTFIVSWCIINWKILYVTFFQSNSDIPKGKVETVQELINLKDSLVWPIVSSIVLITIYPFISEKAFQISLFYKGRKRNIKNKYEEGQLLTLEQSIEIRLQLKNQLEKFDQISADKDQTISELRAQNEGLVNRLATAERRLVDRRPENVGQDEKDFMRFSSNDENVKVLKDLHQNQPLYSTGGYGFEHKETIKELELYGLVDAERKGNMYTYTISDKGKLFLKRIQST